MTQIAPNSAVTDVRQSPNYSPGRPAGAPNQIVIHHWGADGQSHDGVAAYLCRYAGNSSAHYVASAGRVTQLVSDRDRAWHAGSSGNPRGIGIECRPEMSDGDFETVAGLVAAIRSEHGNLPLAGHRDHMSTACPGRWYVRLTALDARARQIAGGAAPAPTTPAPAAPAPAPSGGLTVDGWWGSATTRRLQEVLGTPVDGEVWGQWTGRRSILKAATTGWKWTGSPTGSAVIKAMQDRLGVGADGIMGPATINALEAHYGYPADGRLDGPSNTVKKMQTALNAGVW
nr:N-acetylmuramoyl-L-alanine amidase [Actinomyces sp.]